MPASVERAAAHGHGAAAPVGSGISDCGFGQSSAGSLGTPGGRGPV